MKKTSILLIAIIAMVSGLRAQLFGKRDFAIHQGFISFHNPVLNNRNNANKKISWLNEIDKNLYLMRLCSFNAGIGFGHYENLDNRFSSYQGSNFLRIKTGLVFYLPQKHTATNWSPKRFNPFFKAGYNFDLLDPTYADLNGSRLNSNVRLGFGGILRIKHQLGIIYEFSHNQRLNTDYRSFFQHNLGIIINLDPVYKPY